MLVLIVPVVLIVPADFRTLTCEDTHTLTSRFKQRGLYADPSPVATTSGSARVGETGPRLTLMLHQLSVFSEECNV